MGVSKKCLLCVLFFVSSVFYTESFQWQRRLESLAERTEAACTGFKTMPSTRNKAVVKATNQTLKTLAGWREGQYDIMQELMSGNFDMASVQKYGIGLIPFAIPALLGLLLIPLLLACCCVIPFPACRFGCCKSRKAPYKLSGGKIMFCFILYACIASGVVVFAVLSWYFADIFRVGIQQTNCGIHEFLDGVMNGASSPSGEFIGFNGAKDLVLKTLDDFDPTIEDSVVSNVNRAVESTSIIQDALDGVSFSKSLLQQLLTENLDVNQHTCVFCDMAINDPGLLDTSLDSVLDSAAQGLQEFRTAISEQFGTQTVDPIKQHLTNAQEMMDGFNTWTEGPLDQVSGYLSQYQKIDKSRHLAFSIMSWTACGVFILGGLVFVHLMMSSKPSPVPSACATCFSLGYAIIALIIGGLLFALAIPFSDFCNFTQVTLMTGNNWEVINLAGESKLIAEECLSPNGSGDLFASFNLSQLDDIQKQLNDSFESLGPQLDFPVDLTSLETLNTLATTWGGLFVANPTVTFTDEGFQQIVGSSLYAGPTVNPQSQSFSMGLVLGADPEDQIANADIDVNLDDLPDLSYENLIAPYFFSAYDTQNRALEDALTLTTPATFTPLSEDYSNAIEFAKIKAGLLDAASVDFACHNDQTGVFDGCSYESFKAETNTRTNNLLLAAQQVKDSSDVVESVMINDLWPLLDNTIQGFIQLPKQLNCQFLYHSFNAVLEPVCDVAVRNMLLVSMCWIILGIFSFVGFILQYRIFRKIVDYRRAMKKQTKNMIHPSCAPGAGQIMHPGMQMQHGMHMQMQPGMQMMQPVQYS